MDNFSPYMLRKILESLSICDSFSGMEVCMIFSICINRASTALPLACGRHKPNCSCAEVRIRSRATFLSRALASFCPLSPGKQDIWLSFVVCPMLGMLGLKGRQLITAPLFAQHKENSHLLRILNTTRQAFGLKHTQA